MTNKVPYLCEQLGVEGASILRLRGEQEGWTRILRSEVVMEGGEHLNEPFASVSWRKYAGRVGDRRGGGAPGATFVDSLRKECDGFEDSAGI